MKKIKHLLTILLAVAITATSLPCTVYADGVQNSADNGGDKQESASKNQAEEVGTSVSGVDFFQGYRFYLINSDLERITDVYDFLFEGVPSNIGKHYYDTRFDTSNSPSGHKEGTMSDLKEWCTLPQTTTWTNPTKPIVGLAAKGADFRKWFLQDDGSGATPGIGVYDETTGKVSGGSSSKGSSSGSGNGGNVTVTEPEETTEVEKKRDESAISQGKSLYNSNVDYTSLCSAYAKENGIPSAGVGSVLSVDVSEKIDSDVKDVAKSYMELYGTFIKFYWKDYTGMTLSECKYAALTKVYASMPKGDSVKANICKLALKNLYNGCALNEKLLGDRGDSVASINPEQQSLLTQSIPLAGTNGTTSIENANISEKDANQPAFCMLNKKDTIVIYDTAKYGVNAAKALADHDCLLVVEPIFILKMMKQPGITNFAQSCLAKYYDTNYTYGSYYNIIKNWKGSQVCTYVPRIDKLMPNSMITGRTFTTATGKQIIGVNGEATFYTDSSKRMTQLAEAVNTVGESGGKVNGIAMHVYDASDFLSKSQTSTYDESQGSTPAPAPDPTSLPPETTDYPTTSKQVTIIKNYVTLDQSVGIETVDGNYIRTLNPHIIDIEDEPEYKVVDWQTSMEKVPPLKEADNGNTNYTYEQLTQSSTKTQSGTTEYTVTLTDTEFILYVKLSLF